MPASRHAPRLTAAVIGAGPAGLIAAETLSAAGLSVTVFDRMPSAGRKLLMAGRGGLNLTHDEPLEAMFGRYGTAADRLAPALRAYPPSALIAWANGLGQPTFVGSSGRVFPTALKASPLLRAWLARLAALGVVLRTRHHWTGWRDGALAFDTPVGPERVAADVAVLALGGASWPRLGSDGSWTAALAACAITPLRPANCGFRVAWSETLRARFAGTPLKRIALSFDARSVRGEAVLTNAGIEGGAVYALAAPLRDAIATRGRVTATLDLRPDLDHAVLAARLGGDRRGQSLSTVLRKAAGLAPVAIALVQEDLRTPGRADVPLVERIKAMPLVLDATAPIARAISTAGGLAWSELDDRFMVRRRPGVFACGEMLDWEAPTGGYLLQACFATGIAAARGARSWIAAPG